MNQNTNFAMKKILQKIFDYFLKNKKYQKISSVEVVYAFTSRFKTAMCQSVVGIKVKSNIEKNTLNNLINELKSDVKKVTDEYFGHSVCVLDVIFENN